MLKIDYFKESLFTQTEFTEVWVEGNQIFDSVIENLI
jgi:hypothetical protein